MTKVADADIAQFSRNQHDWMERVLKGSLDPKKVARAVQAIINRGQDKFDCNAEFVTGPGLWVSDDFRRIIAKPLGVVVRQSAVELKDPVTLPRNMSDSEICSELLGGEYQARLDAVCPSQIKELIMTQSEGVAGKLSNDGCPNIFYMLVSGVLFTVSVRWNSCLRCWNVNCYRFDEDGFWLVGRPVFSNRS